MKNFVQGALRRFGYRLVSDQPLIAFIAARQVDLVLDVGASRGHFGALLRSQGYRGNILSFEPVAASFARLRQRIAGDPDWSAMSCAIGEKDGTISLNISERPAFSSAKTLSALAPAFAAKSRVIATETVELCRLDSIKACDCGKRLFVKVDTQGFEQEVVAGAHGLFDKIVGLQLELPVEHLYEDVWSFAEAVATMENLGFALAQIRPVNALHDDPTSAIEFDCIFRRRD